MSYSRAAAAIFQNLGPGPSARIDRSRGLGEALILRPRPPQTQPDPVVSQPVSSSNGTLSSPIMREPSRFLKSVVALSVEAGRRIMEIYLSDFRIAHKDDRSPFTAADLVAHHFLVKELQRLRPSHPVLSEESAEIAFEERQTWETYWLIDPVDGTREFIKRNGEFTINVALVHRNQPVLGVVYAPAIETCYFAAEHCGAFKRGQDGECRPIGVRMRAPERPRVLGSRSHPSAAVAGYLRRLGSYDLLSIGSSLKFCLVAEGEADLCPGLGPTSEWDTAAAQCVVEAAGGKVIDLAGVPLRYNGKSSVVNPYFLVYGDSSRDWRALADGAGGLDSPAAADPARP